MTKVPIRLQSGPLNPCAQLLSSTINPASQVMEQSIDATELERLPLASSNPLLLLSLSSGTNGRGSASITDVNVAKFDTVPLPNPAVFQDFKVATSLYDASQGGKLWAVNNPERGATFHFTLPLSNGTSI